MKVEQLPEIDDLKWRPNYDQQKKETFLSNISKGKNN